MHACAHGRLRDVQAFGRALKIAGRNDLQKCPSEIMSIKIFVIEVSSFYYETYCTY